MSKAQHNTGGTDTTASSDVRQTDAAGIDEPPVATPPGDDELFEILSNRRRRFALHYLHQRGEEAVSLSTLSERIAAWEDGVDPETLDYQQKKSVRNSLRQFHLPKLDDAGVVAYDDDDGVVELVDGTGAAAYHDVVGDGGDERPWMAYCLGVAVGSLGVFALIFLGVLTMLANVAWTALVLTVLALAGAAYARVAAGDDVRDGPPPECRD